MTSCLPELRPLLRPQRRPARGPSAAQLHLLSPRGTDASPAIWNRLPVSTSLIRHLISYFLRKCLFSPLSLLHPVLKYLFASASLQSCDCPRGPRAQGHWTAQNPGKGPAFLGVRGLGTRTWLPQHPLTTGASICREGQVGPGKDPSRAAGDNMGPAAAGKVSRCPGGITSAVGGAPSSPHSPPC